ncbi:MAG: riboflavin biosynthesis protein RibF, partial [Alphaproteobacteria bacterium]
MRIVHGWEDLALANRGAAVALGNFDGAHLGHRQVIADAAAAARAHQAPVGVVSFEPHPRRYFQPDAEPFRLMTPHQLARALGDMGADILYLLPFDARMVAMSDEDFARDVLARGLGIIHAAAGFDFTFGKGRMGDAAALARYGETLGFSVSITQPVGDGELDKYSSTAAREALVDGRPDRAEAILGRPFAIEGAVQQGSQLGRKLGFPTANVALSDYVVPKLGIYATRTILPDGRKVDGVASLGRNPTTGEVAPRLEVWLFDFDEDL